MSKKKKMNATCKECAYAEPVTDIPYAEAGYIKCTEKETDLGKSRDFVYVPTSALCNIFKGKDE